MSAEKHLGKCENCRMVMSHSQNVDTAKEVMPMALEHGQRHLQAIDVRLRLPGQQRQMPCPLLQSFNGAVKIARSVSAILLIGVMALLLSSCLSQTHQTKSPEAPVAQSPLGKLAFVKAGDIWVKELPDGEAKQLTHDGRNSQPRWSPSGEWLAFRKETTSWLIRASGDDVHQIQGNFGSWSPVADRLAYVTAAGLFIVNAGGSDPRELAKSTGGTQVGGPAWAPDGNWLGFEKTEQAAGQPPSGRSLWRMKTDGTEMKEVYSSPNPAEGSIQARWLVARWPIPAVLERDAAGEFVDRRRPAAYAGANNGWRAGRDHADDAG
ncbi:MAG: hypothetical protein M1343_12535 [Chloroflexi bacterium]|nr:hypothetical protein [Chloroflexota bacterium]